GDELALRARAGGSPEAAWQAAASRGCARAALGDRAAAIAAYREAEGALDRQGLLVPLGAGRASFLGDRERSARELIDLLLLDGRAGEALDVARTARARALAIEQGPSRVGGLAPRDRARWDEAIARYQRERERLDRETDGDWRLAAARLDAARERRSAARARADAALDDAASILAERPITPSALAAPREGELVLAFFPAGAGRYHLFAAERGEVTERLLTDPSGASPDALAARILAPVADAIDRARRLRVLAYGPFHQIDLHALPFRGGPLLARIPVEYGLDLPRVDPPPRRDRALVVADTRDDLPAARAEAASVALALGGAFRIASLPGETATRPALLAGLARADLFHFAGHGVFAGATGWDSGLELAESGRLTLGDVLAQPRVPARVVLSGCETGRTLDHARGADLGMAHAFLAAGAQAVIAAVRPIDDRVAGELAAALYQGAATDGWDLVEALRVAELEVRDRAPERDWAAYRIITR
ncbi:MAG: CHAT domain-containing protein, partial [Byssovorax sp.]